MLNSQNQGRSSTVRRLGSEAARRLFDIVFSAACLILLSPALLVIVAAICLESGRPIFFKQVRLGRHGRPFNMYKFRKFHKDCGTSGPPLTLQKDPRLTSVGNFLASSKFDELPQLWNTLRGDMSVIGPRPESMAFADCFTGNFKEVLDHKPGILGPSQVTFRNENALYPRDSDPIEFYRREIFTAKALIDLQYYSQRSFFQDILWLIYGVLAVLRIGPRLPRAKIANLHGEAPHVMIPPPKAPMTIHNAAKTRGTEA
ncbi:sugar transferase [Microvirga sp. Mcv34]|uniref:sugar transferase n=1 Tax=Microvirga sp. Mcv34 TaxID=2926016 RepID=UPI0021C96D80|nr:sugar transferase [Microvirga sp. Mcv34]